jgi:hypothetical protein
MYSSQLFVSSITYLLSLLFYVVTSTMLSWTWYKLQTTQGNDLDRTRRGRKELLQRYDVSRKFDGNMIRKGGVTQHPRTTKEKINERASFHKDY